MPSNGLRRTERTRLGVFERDHVAEHAAFTHGLGGDGVPLFIGVGPRWRDERFVVDPGDLVWVSHIAVVEDVDVFGVRGLVAIDDRDLDVGRAFNLI